MKKNQFGFAENMIKKILSFGGVCCFLAFGSFAAAQEGGQVILDLSSQEEFKDPGIPGLIEMGWNYIEDVKDYNQQLDGNNIEKDLTADIRAKYPIFDEKKAEDWQKYIKKGVKGVRFYEDLKKKLVSWVMQQQAPLVVAENQYEMGEAETYIESENPVIIHDFKKVVAYSDTEKDQLAAREKYAKDHNLPLPSKQIEKYKKALLEKDWATLFDFNWRQYFANLYEHPEGKSDIGASGLKTAILSQFDTLGKKGAIAGTIIVEPPKNSLVLLSDFDNYKGLSVDFSKSENLKDVQVHFVWPQQLKVQEKREIQIYATKFPIYFSGKAIDKSKPVKISPEIKANVCEEFDCFEVVSRPELEIKSGEKATETSFATYIRMVAMNVPREKNGQDFEFKSLVLEKGNDESPASLRLKLTTKDAPHFKIFIAGDLAKHFAPPRLKIDGNKVTAHFELIDQQFMPLGQEVGFWVSTSGTNQYLHKMTVTDMASADTEGIAMSLKILGLAFIGGLLLNLMPCVFPVLSLKILAFTKFGGLNAAKIRSNFIYNCLGIGVSFVMIGLLLTGLKLAGYALGWGMQFQNIYFMASIIWVVTLFLAYVLGLLDLPTPEFANKILDRQQNRGRWFEFLSGMFLVLLSTPCMAPYLGTAFGVALAGSIGDILLTVGVVGLGLATPYLLIAACPQIAHYLPKPGKWLDSLNILMVLMLMITLGWLVSVLAAQSSSAEIWHWTAYILLVLILLFFRKTFRGEIDKLPSRQIARVLYRRIDLIFGLLILGLFIVSVSDASLAVSRRRDVVAQTKLTEIDPDVIAENVRLGNKVLVKVGADWCLTCQYNEAFVFDVEYIADVLLRYNVRVFEVDWTQYNSEVLQFMGKFGRRGLPFYVLFSPAFPDGIVLPEMLRAEELQALVEM